VTFIYMVFHWPAAGRREALAASMAEMRNVLAGRPGLLGVDPPYLTDDGECLVGISRWESEAAFRAANFPARAPDEIVPGETRPRQRFYLTEV